MRVKLEVWIMRHAAAEEAIGKPDGERLLTDEGYRAARHQGEKLKESGVSFGSIITSPLKRAIQTSDEIAKAVGYRGEILEDTRLGFDATSDEMLEMIWEQKVAHPDLAHLLIVGHAPAVGHFKGRLLHVAEETKFSKAHVYGFAVEFNEDGTFERAEQVAHLVPA